jgi:hypothetical protein
LLKLPLAVRDVFQDWLRRHYPDKVERVEGAIRSTRGGKLSDSRFSRRQVGEGNVAELIADTFRVWHAKLGYIDEAEPLNCEAFEPPAPTSGQMRLF